MDPVNSKSGNGFMSIPYPLDLVDQAREVMLGANQELFSANTADISATPAEFSPLSYQLSSRLDEFSTLLSTTDFFSGAFFDQSRTAAMETQDAAFSGTVEDALFDQADTDKVFSSSQDPETRAQSVRTVIDEYNELVEWLDNSQDYISPSLKADLFKNINSDVLEGIGSDTSPARYDASVIHTGETASQARETNGFSPQVTGSSDSSAESALSKIGLALNADGTLDVEETFEQQFKADVGYAYDALSGEDGFFTKISSALDTLNNRDSRFNVNTRNDTTQVYTGDAQVQVRNAYRANVALLLNTFA